ncbi:hypothetical protein [Methylobacterium thuringiense]|uniref:hypothetical protein n=1 Tax=Methylobacterium thuringiense TaxID=1003091 RepID=UPI001EE03C9C|nr:hypothetical protein [Methylobacterium thuringiense]
MRIPFLSGPHRDLARPARPPQSAPCKGVDVVAVADTVASAGPGDPPSPDFASILEAPVRTGRPDLR